MVAVVKHLPLENCFFAWSTYPSWFLVASIGLAQEVVRTDERNAPPPWKTLLTLGASTDAQSRGCGCWMDSLGEFIEHCAMGFEFVG